MKYLLTLLIFGGLHLQVSAQTYQAKNTKATPSKKATQPVATVTPVAPVPETTAAEKKAPQNMLLPISDKAVRKSYPLEASYIKTTHIIFPSKIIYVDLGSDGIIVDKADPTDNVLRIKANKLGFEQTTLVVITEEGKYYPFLVDFNDNPNILHLNILTNVSKKPLQKHSAALSARLELTPI